VTIKENKIYLCDYNNKRISTFALDDGHFLSDFHLKEGYPLNITIVETNLFLTTLDPYQLCCYSLDGKLQKAIKLDSAPRGLCVTNSLIFVCEGDPKHRIEIFDAKTLKTLKTFGEGKFDWPINVIVHNDLFYISDWGHHCIQIWTKDGKYVKSWGKKGKDDGKLNNPSGLACNGMQLFVVDHNNYRIQIFE